MLCWSKNDIIWFFKYYCIILSITNRLHISLYESIYEASLDGFRFGVICVTLSISGYFSVMIICVTRCVRCSIILGDNFFIPAICMILLPTACDALDLLMILDISLILSMGIVKVSSTLSIIYFSIFIGVMLLSVVKLYLILAILLIK